MAIRWLPAVGVVFVALCASAPATAATTPRVAVLYSNPEYAVLGVDDRGVSYGVDGDKAHQNALFESSDQARTWWPVYYFPKGSRIVLVRPVGHSTLLAGVLFGDYALWRSGDDGRSWTDVHSFPTGYGLLTPHSIATDGRGRVVMAAYNYFRNAADHPTPILRSADYGRSWKVVFVERTSRHAHCTSYDPYTGYFYVCFGDWFLQNQILRSTDGGRTWAVVVRGAGNRAVDITFDRTYIYFGQDNQDHDSILRVDKKTGATEILATTAGASYSALRLRDGTFLIGETHEPRGSVYAGERTVHLYASRNGTSWVDVMQRPIRPDGAGYAYIDAYYEYPNGSVPLLISGYGTVVVRVGPPFPSLTRPAEPAASSPARRNVAPQGPGVATSRETLLQGIAAALFGAASLLVATAAWIRRLAAPVRGPVTVGGRVVVEPMQLVAAAVSLVIAAVFVFLLS